MTNTQQSKVDQKAEGTPRELFGQIALRKGFIDSEQLDAALTGQKQRAAMGEKHKLLGLIMLELGFLSNAQLIEILKYIESKTGTQVD